MITYSLGREPVSRRAGVVCSDQAKLTSEIFERLLELDALKHDASAALIHRLATLANLSRGAYRATLRVGCGQIDAVVTSYEEQAKGRGLTRQALHWQWAQDMRAIGQVFPALASMLQELRDTVAHHEDAMSAADGLRRAGERDDG